MTEFKKEDCMEALLTAKQLREMQQEHLSVYNEQVDMWIHGHIQSKFIANPTQKTVTVEVTDIEIDLSLIKDRLKGLGFEVKMHPTFRNELYIEVGFNE